MKTLIVFISFLFVGNFVFAQSVEEGRYLAIRSGYGLLSSSLAGSGFNSELPSKGGVIYGVDMSCQNLDSDTWYKLSYDKISVDQVAPSGVNPSNISIYREEIRFVVSFAPWDAGALEKLRLGIGYSFLESGGPNTSPNNILTTQTSQGLILNALYSSKFKSKYVLQTEFLIYLPHQIRESQQVTGYNPKYIGAELKVTADYALSEDILGFVGLSYRYDQVSFSGSVNRGVTGGQDTRTMFAIPIGIKIGY
jgi:hypothetical protein